MNSRTKKLLLKPFTVMYKIAPVFEQKIMFKMKCGYKLDLKSPMTYNQKLAWMKLYDRNSLMPKLSDKYLMRQYVIDNGYGEHLPKLFWNGYCADEIPYDNFPEKFVVKVTSGSGNNIIVRNKNTINKSEINKLLKNWLKEKYLPAYGEWFYGVEKPRIIVEEFLDNGLTEVPPDYKMMYFNGYNGGDVAFTCVDTERFVEHKRTLYNCEWVRMDDKSFGFKCDLENYIEKPACYDEMVVCARKLSEPFVHARIDFYVIGTKFYIGEITFLNGAGYDHPLPMDFAKQMGEWMILPQKKDSN